MFDRDSNRCLRSGVDRSQGLALAKGPKTLSDHLLVRDKEQRTNSALERTLNSSLLDDRSVDTLPTALAEMERAQADLHRLERDLRELWHGLVGEEPVLAARARVAANFLHNAAAALDPDTVL